jgi:hypothetical protein
VYLVHSNERLHSSWAYMHRQKVSRNARVTQRAEFDCIGQNMLKSLIGADIDLLDDGHIDDYALEWSMNTLRKRQCRERSTANQEAVKSRWRDEFVVDDYTWRWARSRKVWLLQSEVKLLERQGKRRDSLQEDEAREEVETSKKEKRLGTVQLLAARRLHSSLTSEQIKQLSVTLTDNIQSKESGTVRPLARVVVQEPAKLVFDHDGATLRTSILVANILIRTTVDGEHTCCPTAKSIGSVLGIAREGTRVVSRLAQQTWWIW